MNTSIGQGAAVIHISQFLQLQGVDIHKVCERSGISLQELNKIELVELESFWKEAILASGDAYLGLHIGEDSGFSALGIVGELIQHSSTIQHALENACIYLNLLTSAFKAELQIHGNYADLVFIPSPDCKRLYPTALQQSLDWAMVFSLREYQLLTLEQAQPLLVQFTYPEPEQLSMYKQVFSCPIHFEAKQYLIRFDKNVLIQKILLANYDLLKILEQYAQKQISLLEKPLSFSKNVEQAILRQSNLALPQIEDIARTLNMSTRTLQRKLKAEDTSFQNILDEIRKNLALEYLQDSTIPVKEISFLLGYNEVSAFGRALKRWTGKTPTQYR
ncbi:MAG: AraC family transcriptional regulator [Aureispira sp.]|nr:AraC family transcriptional regulator [Aureispira sp.]